MDQLLDDSGHVLDQNGANVQAVDMVQHSMDDVHGQDDGIDANQLTDITYTQAEESARLILLQKEFPSREAAQFAIQQHHVQFTAPMEDEMRGNVVYHKQKQNRKRESYEYWYVTECAVIITRCTYSRKRGDHNIPTCPWKAEVSCMGTLHTGGKVYQVTNLMYESQHSHQGNSVKRMRSIGVRDVKNESQMGQGQHPDDLIGGSDPNAIPVPLEQPIVRKRQSKRPRKDNQEMSIPMAIPMNMDSQHVGTQAVRGRW